MKRCIFVLTLIAAISCSDNDAELVEFTEPSPTTVWVEDGGFNPADLFIQAGESVTLYVKDNMTAVISSADSAGGKPLFESRILIQGSKYSYKFNDPGVYSYYNKLESSVRGNIHVE